MQSQLLQAAKHALEFIQSIDGYENSKTANELRQAIEAVEHGVQATGLTFCLRCGIWQPVNAAGECGICHPPRA